MTARLCTICTVLAAAVYAENIDPYNSGAQFGWGENVGWLNFEPAMGTGTHVEEGRLTGFVWAENIGWINLSCETTAFCENVNFGVVRSGSGILSGFAWAENVGWINFDPVVPGEFKNQYRVRVDSEGRFTGWAWAENIGWIRFDAAQSWNARACVVTLDDLTNFAAFWLQSGGVPANLDTAGTVDMADYAIFASWWQDFCPDAWPLK